ncbi:hypothetical protein [Bacillus sp. 7884-1]|uniref:hypothetical protein n=1 Tax=Bacillus sp. 7884-1 TaxID=2021693 RepID=UPI000BA553B1|nr:hypothetical protein [Bacillus sp. 7884-1]PAE37379.1 hypothetical protein CHI06_20380 [Bacillus sp. 7884-1]
MNICNANASSIQLKVFEDSEELNHWLKENKAAKELDIKFRSMVIIDEIVIRDCYLVIYK